LDGVILFRISIFGYYKNKILTQTPIKKIARATTTTISWKVFFSFCVSIAIK